MKTKQQIMITIDSSSTNSHTQSCPDSQTNTNESSNVCKILQNKLKNFKKILRAKDLPEAQPHLSNAGLEEEKESELTVNGKLKNDKAKNPIELNDQNIEIELKQLMRNENELDYEIEQIDEQLEQNIEKSLKQHNFNSSKCKHYQSNQDRLMVKRPSKQSINFCTKCSNLNNNCECRSHHQKQLIKSTKSTPITGNDIDRLKILHNNRTTKRTPLRNQLDTSSKLNNRIEVILQRSRYKVAKMMIIIIFVFFLCWLPLYILFFKLKLGFQITKFKEWEEKITFILAPIAQWLCYINSCLNPILYNFLNKKYRAEFKKLFSNFHPFSKAKKNENSQNLNQRNVNLKASVKSHPSISVKSANYDRNYVQNFDRTYQKNNDRCLDRKYDEERKNCEENFKKISKSPNDFQFRPHLIIKDHTRPCTSFKKSSSLTKFSLDRSLSDTNLIKRITVKRATSSGSLFIL